MTDLDWLPDSYESSRVLDAVRDAEAPLPCDVPERYRDSLIRIRSEYQAELRTLGSDFEPRNLPFYRIIRRRYPRFSWMNVGRQTDVETYYRGKKHSLLAYLLHMIPSDEIATSAKVSRAGATAKAIEDMERYLPQLRDLGACSLRPEDIKRLNRWIERARAGAPSTIVSPVCPDYSAEAGEERKFRFTFQSVGSGCGLSGMRLLESIQLLHGLLRDDLGCRSFSHHICVGDFEAYSEANLARVGLTVDGFIACNRGSAEALAKASPVPVETSLFTDHCGGRQGWEERYRRMLARFEGGEFGALRERQTVREIAEARRSLYERWHDKAEADIDFLIDIVIQQGAEYATMGEVIAEKFDNPLVVGADHRRMAPFYNFGGDIPVLYLDRNYD